jgi:peptidoglycan/xylan/chitin deacetylase (PgdA/CDA1 family)
LVTAVALTFDDGPDAVWTPRLLSLLSALEARATFFPIARRAAAHPDLIERILDEGHTIGLHCDEHVRHSERDEQWGRADTASALGRLEQLDVRPSLWRTPWGDTASWSVPVAREHDLRIVGWSVDTHDWRGDRAQDMFLATKEAFQGGTIVLAHDGLGPGALRDGAEETLGYVELVADYARSRGLALEALG